MRGFEVAGERVVRRAHRTRNVRAAQSQRRIRASEAQSVGPERPPMLADPRRSPVREVHRTRDDPLSREPPADAEQPREPHIGLWSRGPVHHRMIVEHDSDGPCAPVDVALDTVMQDPAVAAETVERIAERAARGEHVSDESETADGDAPAETQAERRIGIVREDVAPDGPQHRQRHAPVGIREVARLSVAPVRRWRGARVIRSSQQEERETGKTRELAGGHRRTVCTRRAGTPLRHFKGNATRGRVLSRPRVGLTREQDAETQLSLHLPERAVSARLQ